MESQDRTQKEHEINRLIGAVFAVMRSLYRSAVVKNEQSQKAKLLIYQSIYFPTPTYGNYCLVICNHCIVNFFFCNDFECWQSVISPFRINKV